MKVVSTELMLLVWEDAIIWAIAVVELSNREGGGRREGGRREGEGGGRGGGGRGREEGGGGGGRNIYMLHTFF